MTPPCAQCGRPHLTQWNTPSCTGHVKKDGGRPCTRSPVAGATVCPMHGGSAPQVKAKATERREEAAAAKAVHTLGLPVDVSPTDALLEEVRWTAGHVQWLRQRVQDLHEEPTHTAETLDGEDAGYATPSGRGALTWGTTKVVTGDKSGTTQEAKPSIWYELYAKERAHLVLVCTAAIKAGVEERKVRLAERQGDLVVELLRRVLDGLYAALLTAGLTDAQLQAAWSAAVADVVPRELRRLAGEAS